MKTQPSRTWEARPALQQWSRPAFGQSWTGGRARVVVRERESRPHGEGGQLDECRTRVNYAGGGMYEPDSDGGKAGVSDLRLTHLVESRMR